MKGSSISNLEEIILSIEYSFGNSNLDLSHWDDIVASLFSGSFPRLKMLKFFISSSETGDETKRIGDILVASEAVGKLKAKRAEGHFLWRICICDRMSLKYILIDREY